MTKSNGRNAAMQETQEVTLRDVLSPLFRHQRVVMITFCTALVATILVAWLWASQYYVATMQVVVEQDRSDTPITAGQAGVIQTKNITLDQVSSEVALLQGEDMMRTVAATCGLRRLTPMAKVSPATSSLWTQMEIPAQPEGSASWESVNLWRWMSLAPDFFRLPRTIPGSIPALLSWTERRAGQPRTFSPRPLPFIGIRFFRTTFPTRA